MGALPNTQDVLPAPLGSGEIKVPRELEVGRPTRDEGARQAPRPSAAALRRFQAQMAP